MPTLLEAREAVGDWIELYHRSEHRGDGMNGSTPLAVWNTARTLRRANEDELLFLLQSRGVYKVGPNGVKFKVGNTTLSYGAGCSQLYRHRGREVFITIDPSDLSHCAAWTVEPKRFIARLESNERISPLATVDELREAIAAVQSRRKIGRTAMREAPARTRTVARELSAQRRERLIEARATGTDDCKANIVPVRTGFDAASKPVQTKPPSRRKPISLRDLSCFLMDDEELKGAEHERDALHGMPDLSDFFDDDEPGICEDVKPKTTLAMLAAPWVKVSPTDEGDVNGTEADLSIDGESAHD